jgi:hypothetical protein
MRRFQGHKVIVGDVDAAEHGTGRMATPHAALANGKL